ncbi:DUF3093 family protein [uncultured Microbacterium sp.]|uniref:DUF3093 family protein n=1 Tax=uncultured Microbacterium sp. TaxID=191216 RepID=UPI0025E9FAA9|nr:DUF3093 family protein [uncultured Microbacterium sp.]
MQTARETYRERLSPSLWAIVSAAVVAPMATLVFAPINATLALAAGAVVAIVVVILMQTASPSVRVAHGELLAGRAHIPVTLLGDPAVLTGEEAREARGPGLPGTAWHLFRGGIDGVVVVPVIDPDDPVSVWVIASRTPDRLAAAIRAEQRAETPAAPVTV